jgi:hypothetical protein
VQVLLRPVGIFARRAVSARAVDDDTVKLASSILVRSARARGQPRPGPLEGCGRHYLDGGWIARLSVLDHRIAAASADMARWSVSPRPW